MNNNETQIDKGLSRMLTTKEVLEILRISRSTLYRYMEQGQLKAYKFSGKDLRFKETNLKAFNAATDKKG